MQYSGAIVVVGFVALSASAQPEYAVPHPHPMITEVLFNVPQRDDAGDANRDGTRDAAGDESIEIANPYDHPINLRGYTLSSRLASPTEDTGKGVRFVFPDVELGSHKVALVFNGYKASISGPVGSSITAPATPHADFDGALVFSIKTTSRTRALRNSGDFVLLSAPNGTPLDCVTWGESDPSPPSSVLRIADVDASTKGSIQRVLPDAAMVAHRDIDGRPFSPGEIPQVNPQ